jgi:DNA end-binding protein Ku
MGLTDRELKMGEQLVLDMAEPWSPQRFRDEFAEKVEALVEAKRKSGAITQVVELIGDARVGREFESG